MNKILYLDAIAGISGDMMLAALLDLGLPLEYLENGLKKLGLPDDSFIISKKQVQRQGVAGCHIEVMLADGSHHEGDHHHHRCYADIRRMIETSALSGDVKALALRVFLCLAEAEALVHGVSADDVRFHEVGALDSILDIVGTAIGIDYLNVDKIYVSAVPLGGGLINTAHGQLPVPAPATAHLLKGLAVHGRFAGGERVTPTGAAILAALAVPLERMPVMKLTAVGHGAGTKDFIDCPNLVRAFLGDMNSEDIASDGQIVEVRCNLDDVTPEIVGYTMERLFEGGALDVWTTPIQMKKCRPAVQLSFICRHGLCEMLSQVLMSETGSLGLRYNKVERFVSDRSIDEMNTRWGMVRFKSGKYGGKPEYEDCRRIAREHGIALRDVQRAVADGALRAE